MLLCIIVLYNFFVVVYNIYIYACVVVYLFLNFMFSLSVCVSLFVIACPFQSRPISEIFGLLGFFDLGRILGFYLFILNTHLQILVESFVIFIGFSLFVISRFL